MPAYLEGFHTFLDPILVNNRNEQTCVSAMEFWETLIVEYKDLTE